LTEKSLNDAVKGVCFRREWRLPETVFMPFEVKCGTDLSTGT